MTTTPRNIRHRLQLRSKPGFLSLVLLTIFAAPMSIIAQDKSPAKVDETVLKNLRWRSIGPSIMGGRIDDIAVVESNPNIFYVGAATGGVWKTVNNGTTFEAIFDEQGSTSIGDLVSWCTARAKGGKRNSTRRRFHRCRHARNSKQHCAGWHRHNE